MLLEALGQPVLLLHPSHPSVAPCHHSNDRRKPTDVTGDHKPPGSTRTWNRGAKAGRISQRTSGIRSNGPIATTGAPRAWAAASAGLPISRRGLLPTRRI